MTLLAAWIRKEKSTEELVIATDSRLRFGAAWDCCPKILMLPRSDAVLCFAGDTMYAYPIMLQIRNAIEMYGKARSRAMDITDLRGHVLRIIEDMRKVDLAILSDELPDWISFKDYINWSGKTLSARFGRLDLIDATKAEHEDYPGILDAFGVSERLSNLA
ncbi:MAG TPA: hypothetical protein VK747_19250 [Blastocatellia bacterium]|nr:hypothetical protein [Blastocatellia bacterium]